MLPDPLSYPALLLRAVGLGVFTGIFGLVYLIGVEVLTERTWPEWETEGWFSGSIWVAGLPILAGLLVGLVYRGFRLPARFPGFIDELKAGHVDPRTAPGAVGVAVISLVGGASLGPEAPLGTAGGAAGTWLSRRRGGGTEETRQLSFVGVSGAFGGLMSTPIGGPLLAFELEHEQSQAYYSANLVPGVVAGAVSFGIMWPVVGAPFVGLLAIPQAEFRSWMLLAAVVLGVVGAVAAVVVGRVIVGITSFMRRLDAQPVLRGLVGGAIVGAVAFALPLTLFSGQASVPIILDRFEEIGLLTLLALSFLKAVALGASLGGGFYGGPIFPMFFIGAVLGVAAHMVTPAIPLGLAVGSMMAAVGAASALLPISMAVLSAVLIQSGMEVFGAVALASVAAYAVRVALGRASAVGDVQRSASPTPQAPLQ